MGINVENTGATVPPYSTHYLIEAARVPLFQGLPRVISVVSHIYLLVGSQSFCLQR